MESFIAFLFWLSFGILLYIYVGYILLLKILTLFYRQSHDIDSAYTPTITLLFSAHNEREALPPKMESLKKIQYPRDKLQIIAISDGSTDGTAEFLQKQEGIQTQVLQENVGKNAALNLALPNAKGEILFFTDANTVLHPHCFRAIARNYADKGVGCVTGNLVFAHEKEWNAVGRGTGLYWQYENRIKQLENQLGSVLVGGGSLLTVRTNLVDSLTPQIANDLEIPLRVGSLGYKVLYEPGCLGFEKPHTSILEEFHRTSRIVSRGLRGFATLFPILLHRPFRLWQFLSHKFLRWFTLPLCGVLFVSAWILKSAWYAAGIFYATALFLGCALMGIIVMNRSPHLPWLRPFTIPAHFLLMQAGAVWGLLLTMWGKTPAKWRIPESSR